MNFKVRLNDREYVETVYMNEGFCYDLFKNNIKEYTVNVNKNLVSFIDADNEKFDGAIILQSYNEWMDDTDNLVVLHNLDGEDLKEEEKQFIYFIETSIQLFYSAGHDLIWPDKWWQDLDLSKILNYSNQNTNDETKELSGLEKLKKFFHLS